MKNTSGQYAKALYELTKDTDISRIDFVLRNFVKVLAKNGQLRLKNEILQKFEKVSNLKNGIIVVEVKSREKLNSELTEKLSNYIKEKYSAKEVLINNMVDEKIQGGVIVKVGDEIFDASVNGQLQKMRTLLAS